MKDTIYDVHWEIDQVTQAIEYFETAIKDSFSIEESDRFTKTIHKLQNKLRKLEQRRDRE